MGKMFVSPMNRSSPSTETVSVATDTVSAVDRAEVVLAGCGCTRTAPEAGLNDDDGGGAEVEVEGGVVIDSFTVDGIDSACAWPPVQFFCSGGSAAETLSSSCPWFVLLGETP